MLRSRFLPRRAAVTGDDDATRRNRSLNQKRSSPIKLRRRLRKLSDVNRPSYRHSGGAMALLTAERPLYRISKPVRETVRMRIQGRRMDTQVRLAADHGLSQPSRDRAETMRVANAVPKAGLECAANTLAGPPGDTEEPGLGTVAGEARRARSLSTQQDRGHSGLTAYVL